MKLLMMAACSLAIALNTASQSLLTGAWNFSSGTTEHVYIIQDDYLVFSSYDKINKKFDNTWGGTIKHGNNEFTLHMEFNARNNDEVGSDVTYKYKLQDARLMLASKGSESTLTRIDEGKGDLAGNWRISGRMQGERMNTINPGPRKTLKILSGTRFQWIAINTETKEFFGTGGGTYTFKDGKYTENIEFFSRDSSRVGATLVFDGKVENNVWVHSGLNSRGEPLHEEWKREI